MSNQQQASSGGIGLGMILFIVFLILRLTDNIDWKWYWVASPLWIPIAVVLGIALIVSVIGVSIGAVANISDKVKRK